jgi:pyridoxine 5-phosphate synthase
MAYSRRLHVNIDHIATLRNARGTRYPSPLEGAEICLDAGADGITAHLREDRRHIRDDDVALLGDLLRSVRHTFNLEMAATDEMVGIAAKVRPNIVTLVPERREERTTEGGLDIIGGGEALARQVGKLRGAGLAVSLFIAADDAQIRAAKALDVQQIELHTGDYAHAIEGDGLATRADAELARLAEGAKLAASLGLEVAAGHGLTRRNVPRLMQIEEIAELNIGHAIIADALFLSLREAVLEMRAAMSAGGTA